MKNKCLLYKFHLSINKFYSHTIEYPSYLFTAIALSLLLVLLTYILSLILEFMLGVENIIFFPTNDVKLNSIIHFIPPVSVIYFLLRKSLNCFECELEEGDLEVYADIFRFFLIILGISLLVLIIILKGISLS